MKRKEKIFPEKTDRIRDGKQKKKITLLSPATQFLLIHVGELAWC